MTNQYVLHCTYSPTKGLEITGGDDEHPDQVTIFYGQKAEITWTRDQDKNFHFKDIAFDPPGASGPAGPFKIKSKGMANIVVENDDENTSGEDKEYKYTIQYVINEGGKQVVKTHDPKVINKASSGGT